MAGSEVAPLSDTAQALIKNLLAKVDVNRSGALEAIQAAKNTNGGVEVYEAIAKEYPLEFEGGFRPVPGAKFSSAMARLKKSIGGDKALLAIRSGADVGFGAPPRISWGCANIDYISGGGAPRGRIVQVKGAPSHGKTFACLKLCAEILRMGSKVLWVALEPFDADWARRCGVPVWHRPEDGQPLTPVQEEYNRAHPEGEGFAIIVGEAGNLVLQATVNAVSLNVFDAVIVDSIAVAVSRTHLENKIVGDPSPGGEAGMINQFTSRIQTALNGVESMYGRALQKTFICTTCGEAYGAKKDHEKCPNLEKGKPKFEESTEFGEHPRSVVVIVNQLRATGIGSPMPMAPDAAGGFGLGHGKSLDLRFRGATRLITTSGVTYGIIAQIEADKNKVGPPEREGVAELWVADMDGYSIAGEYNLMTDLVGRTVSFSKDNSKTFRGLAIDAKIIEQRGAWYYLGEEKFQGLDALQEFLAANPLVVQAVRADLSRWIRSVS